MSSPLRDLRMRQKIARLEKQERERRTERQRTAGVQAATNPTDNSAEYHESHDFKKKEEAGKSHKSSKFEDSLSVEHIENCPEREKHRKEQRAINEEEDFEKLAMMLEKKKVADNKNKCSQGSDKPGRKRLRQRESRDASDSDDDLVELARTLEREKGDNNTQKRPQGSVSPGRKRSRQRVRVVDSHSNDEEKGDLGEDGKIQGSVSPRRERSRQRVRRSGSDSDNDLMEHENGVSKKHVPSARNDDSFSRCDAKSPKGTGRADIPADRSQSESIQDSGPPTPSSTTWDNVQMLGSDGKFRIVKNAMGVPGFHIAVNVFSPEAHRQLFDDPIFTAFTMPFVQDQAKPLRQAVTHPTEPPPASMHPWPENWHRLINTVRDSGVFPSATIPDCGYALTYDEQSTFPPHHDGRGKWGEYVIVSSFGGPATVTFQHGAPKRNPVDSTRPWNWDPPSPRPGSYFIKSQTKVPDDMYKRRLWQLSMVIPPNSIYVMSGPSRYDWRHGINWHGRDGVPPLSQESDFPSWNLGCVRRAVVFRSTKIFSDFSLELEEQRAREAGDTAAVSDLVSRRKASARFKYDADDCRGKLGEREIASRRSAANEVLNRLVRSGAHRLRFRPDQVHYDCTEQKRAVADPLLGNNDEAVQRGENAQGLTNHYDTTDSRKQTIAADDEEIQIRRAIELSLADGTQGGTSKVPAARAKRPHSSPEVICLGDSEDEGAVSSLNEQNSSQRQNPIPAELVKWASNHCSALGINLSYNPAISDSAAKDGSRLCFFDGATLVDTHPNSSVGGGWIWARDPSYNHHQSVGDTGSFETEWLDIAKRFSDKSPPKHQDVLFVAEKHGVLHGKWLLRVSLNYAPELWTKIRDGVLDGKLGPTAKILQSAEAGDNVLIVCIYVPDFRDKAEVLRVRRVLQHDLKVYTKSRLYFKPDCFTHIDQFVCWKKLSKSMYSCGGETESYNDLECSTLFTNEAKCIGKKGCPRCYPSCLELKTE